MNIIEKLDSDLKEALKSKDNIRLSVIRMLKASLKNKEIEKMQKLTEDDIISVLQSQSKQRRESIRQFAIAERKDLVEKEEKELEIILQYLPKQLSNKEIDDIIIASLKEASITSPKDIGLAMKIIMPKIKGSADGKYVNQRVRELLTSSS